MKRWDDPEEMLRANTTVDENGCWLWKDRKHNNTYVCITPYYLAKKYKVNRAHQLSYIVYKGEYDRGLVIRHICNVSRCVNPDHLTVGTQRDNLRDSYFNNNNTRVSVETILNIVYLLSQNRPFIEIQTSTNLDSDVLKRIITGQSYSYVSGIKPGEYRVLKGESIIKSSKNWRLVNSTDKQMIKNLYAEDPKINTMTSLAKFYKISLSYVSRIIKGER